MCVSKVRSVNQESATGPFPESDESSPRPQTLSNLYKISFIIILHVDIPSDLFPFCMYFSSYQRRNLRGKLNRYADVLRDFFECVNSFGSKHVKSIHLCF